MWKYLVNAELVMQLYTDRGGRQLHLELCYLVVIWVLCNHFCINFPVSFSKAKMFTLQPFPGSQRSKVFVYFFVYLVDGLFFYSTYKSGGHS